MNARRLALLLALVPLAAQHAAAAPPVPAKIQRFLDDCETARRGAIAQIEHRLRGLSRQSPDAQRDREIARLKTQLRVLQANEKPVVNELSFPPQSGAIGRMPGLACRVEQVVSDREFVATCTFPVAITTVRDFKRYREHVMQTVRVVVRGLPTADLEEGAELQRLEVFEVAGRETYRTVGGGSRAVLVLEPFDLEQVEPYFRQAAARR